VRSRLGRTSPRATAATSSRIAALMGVGTPSSAPRLTTSPLRNSTAGSRPRSIAASIEERSRR
jgi:hypothetical protein